MADKKQGNSNDPLQSVTKYLYEPNDFNNALGAVADKIGVKREYIVAGWITLLSVSLLLNIGVQFLTTLTAICYPAYITISKVENSDKSFRIQWSMYWAIFADFVLIETFVEYIVHFFPFYYLFKVIFIIWCMLPIPSNGSTMLYEKVVAPFILQKSGKGKSS